MSPLVSLLGIASDRAVSASIQASAVSGLAGKKPGFLIEDFPVLEVIAAWFNDLTKERLMYRSGAAIRAFRARHQSTTTMTCLERLASLRRLFAFSAQAAGPGRYGHSGVAGSDARHRSSDRTGDYSNCCCRCCVPGSQS